MTRTSVITIIITRKIWFELRAAEVVSPFGGPLRTTVHNLSREHVEYLLRDRMLGKVLWRFLDPALTLAPYRRLRILRNSLRSTAKCNGWIFGVGEILARDFAAEYLSGARVEFLPDPSDEDQHAR